MLTTLTICSTLLLALDTAAPALPSAGATQVECGDWQDCRDKALAAKEQGDFDLLHDLAWRAVQKGPRNDAALLTLLARAQSLSGRPHDALVMLQRLAGMGVVTDAADSDDFRRVRALPGWADFQAALTKPGSSAAASDAPSAKPVPARPSASAPAATPPAAAESPKTAEKSVVGEVADTLRFITIPFTPAGLAYDTVSNRFILGDRLDRKLSVIGERSQRLVNLAGAESAGFGEIEALAIDAREGDLWVASTVEGEQPASKLHKLQLISGRLLMTATLAAGDTPARITDIAVTPQGEVMALDTAGRRLFRLNPRAKEANLLTRLAVADAASIAPAPGSVVYVASPEGITRVDVVRRASRTVRPAGRISLENLSWIRWHRGSILGVQPSGNGRHRIIRIRLDASGRTATRVDLLEKDVELAGPSSLAVADDALFYLTRNTGYSASGGMEITIRRVRLKAEGQTP